MNEAIEFNRDQILESLHNTICRVVFTKTNGEERVMHCTLNSSMIPSFEASSEKKKENPNVQSVFDVEMKGWRSFRWDSLKSFQSEMNL